MKITKSRTIKATATMLVYRLTMRTIEADEPNMYNARHAVWLEPERAMADAVPAELLDDSNVR